MMSTQPIPVIDVTRDDRGVLTVRLNSPRNRNALSRRLLAELAEALRTANNDPRTRVVVLTGADPVFCAGADLKEQQDGLGPGPVSLPEVLTEIYEHRCPVVARINGPARAGGLGLASAADITVGLTDATFAFTEVRLGVVPAVIAVPVLQRVAPSAAHELFLTGETFDGRRAHELGLLNRAVEPDALDSTVEQIIGHLLLGGPEALAATKRLRHQVVGQPIPGTLNRMLKISQHHFASDEGQSGISALRTKTAPPWVRFVP